MGSGCMQRALLVSVTQEMGMRGHLFRVSDIVFRVQCSGFRVQDLGVWFFVSFSNPPFSWLGLGGRPVFEMIGERHEMRAIEGEQKRSRLPVDASDLMLHRQVQAAHPARGVLLDRICIHDDWAAQ